MKFPRSAYDKVGGLFYFARMLDKIRLQAAGELPADYHANLGKAMDLRTCVFLHVGYAELAAFVRSGASDEQAWEWCARTGHALSDVDILVYNGFSSKRGLRDEVSAELEEFKQKSGLSDRKDLQTFFDYFDADEARPPFSGPKSG
jgi:gluconokinase